MPLGRKKNWFAKFGRRNRKQAAMKKNAEIQCLLLLHLQFQYGCKDSGRKAMLVIQASGTFSRPFCKHFGSSSESFVKHLCISLLNSSLIFVFDFSEFVFLCSTNSSCFCITSIILMYVYHSRTHCPSSWNLRLVSKSWGGDNCTLLLGCSNQNIFICKQEDHM
ncbi:unnamed protein product [Sphagnum balticum]